MNTDNRLFMDTLEQMKKLLSSPAIESRAQDPIVAKTIVEFYELIDSYAEIQKSDLNNSEQSEQLTTIFAALTLKINLIEQHINLNLNKLSFLSKVTPKS